MKSGYTLLRGLMCSMCCAMSIAHAAPARFQPSSVETTTRLRPEKLPNTILRTKPVSPFGVLALSGTAPDGVYRLSGSPTALGRLPSHSGARMAVLAGTRINRKP